MNFLAIEIGVATTGLLSFLLSVPPYPDVFSTLPHGRLKNPAAEITGSVSYERHPLSRKGREHDFSVIAVPRLSSSSPSTTCPVIGFISSQYIDPLHAHDTLCRNRNLPHIRGPFPSFRNARIHSIRMSPPAASWFCPVHIRHSEEWNATEYRL